MASTKVRGITIELGADTSGLSKALKSINQEIGSTQKQLKDVEKLLKLDPHNTELMEQKQRLLADRIGETKTKLEALKEAQKQVGDELKRTGEGQEQYDALTREIASCTNELKALEKEANSASVAMQKLSAAGESVKAAGEKISGVGQALMPLSAAAAGISAGIIKTTADFDASMSKVAAISGAAGEDFDKLRDKAREMGATTKFTASEAAEAMNYMAMAGWKTEDMLSGVSGIMSLAAASGEELGTTSDIVTDALTAFGLAAEDAGHFSDILAAASSNANTNVAMMGESFKYAAPVAGSLGYTAEDIAVALGLMANSGIKASMAGTSLRNIFTRMAKPTKESAMAMERLGLSLDDGKGNMYSFRQIMNQLRQGFVQINMPIEEYDRRVEELDTALENGEIKQKAYNSQLEELNKQAFGAEGAEKARAAAMLGGSRAMSGLLAIANATEADYNKLTAAVDNSSQAFAKTKDGIIPLNEALASGAEIIETYEGSAAAMAATMQDNASGQMEILKSQLQELAISLGDTLMPTIRELVGYAQQFVDKLNGMDEHTKTMIMNATLVTAALGPVLTIVGKLVEGAGTLMTAIGGASATMLGIVGGIGTLAAALVYLWQTDSEFKDHMKKDWNELKEAVNSCTTSIVDSLNSLGFEFKDFSDVVSTIWNNFCQKIKVIAEGIMDRVTDIFSGDFKAIQGLFETFSSLFRGEWESMWSGVKTFFEGIWDAIVAVFTSRIDSIIGKINGVIDLINNIDGVNLSRIPTLYGTVKGITGMASGGVLTSGSAIVGEAGPEFVHISNGQAMVQPLSGNSDLAGLLETYLPYLAAGTQLVMDSGALVGSIAPDMDAALGTISIRSGNR